jgi:hypothetical protein
MKQFKDFGITAAVQGFVGDKIKMERILNREVMVCGYKIEVSRFTEKGNGKCLHMQIGIGEQKYVVFTGSKVLMDTIDKIPKYEFPFKTTIIKINDHFEFT